MCWGMKGGYSLVALVILIHDTMSVEWLTTAWTIAFILLFERIASKKRNCPK